VACGEREKKVGYKKKDLSRKRKDALLDTREDGGDAKVGSSKASNEGRPAGAVQGKGYWLKGGNLEGKKTWGERG